MIVAPDAGIIKAMGYSRYSKDFEVIFTPWEIYHGGIGPIDIYVDGGLIAPTKPVLINRVTISAFVRCSEFLRVPGYLKPPSEEEKRIARKSDTFRRVEFEYTGYDWNGKKTIKKKVGSPYEWKPGETDTAKLSFIDITDVFYGPGLNIVWVKLEARKRHSITGMKSGYFPAKAEGVVDLGVAYGD